MKRSFAYQAGAIAALTRRMTPAIEELLADVVLGKRTLLDLYQAWVKAGSELGELVAERERLLNRNGRQDGAQDIDMRSARQQWITVTHAFIGTIDLMGLESHERAAVLSPLQAEITTALRNRDRNAEQAPNDNSQPDNGAPVNDAPVGDTPVNDAPVDDAPVNDAPVDDTPRPLENVGRQPINDRVPDTSPATNSNIADGSVDDVTSASDTASADTASAEALTETPPMAEARRPRRVS